MLNFGSTGCGKRWKGLVLSRRWMTKRPSRTPQPDLVRFVRRPSVLNSHVIHADPARSRYVDIEGVAVGIESNDDPQCDRIQPCTACSLHQIAAMCQYDLTETERQPILQAEALKEKDKAIASLRSEIQLLRGQPQVKAEPRDDDISTNSPQSIRMSSSANTRPVHLRQRRLHSSSLQDNLYFGSPAMSSVMEEVGFYFLYSKFYQLKAVSLPTCLSVDSQQISLI